MSTPPTSQAALRRLLIVLAVVIGVGIYSYGWTVTRIDLRTPQEPTRQQNVTNALQELLSPHIFDQQVIQVTSTAPFLINCEEGEVPAPVVPPEDGAPYIVVEPSCGVPGEVVTVNAYNFAPNVQGQIRWIPLEGQSRPRDIVNTGQSGFVMNDLGGFVGQIEVPRIGGTVGQTHRIGFVANVPDGPVEFSEITHEVIRRMIETIFMALLATSLAIPIAAVLSFLAARNLMKTVRLPFGTLALTIVAVPVGWLLGTLFLAPVAEFAIDLGSGDLLGASTAMIPFLFLLGVTTTARGLRQSEPEGDDTLRSLINLVLAVLVVTFFIGLIGGLGLLGRVHLANFANTFRPAAVTDFLTWLVNAIADGIAGFGYMVGILGGLVDLFVLSIAGLLGVFTVASVAGRLLIPAINRAEGIPSHVIGGILGGLAGAVVMAGVATIGRSAALMGLVTPLVPALFAGQIAMLLIRRYMFDPKNPSRSFPVIRSVGYFVAAAIVYTLVFILLNIGRTMVTGLLPSSEPFALGLPLYDLQAAVIGLILAGIYGALSGVHNNFLLGDVLYNITRTTLNALRSIEPLIMGLIFVVWVGIGPFAGVLALTLHSIASLGKLYSEQIENIDEGPIEALKSTGANQLQTIVFAVVPQIVPPYIAFTMYRWDINVRMSTIIGFVGGGGIGLLLNQQINLLRYRDAGVAVLAIAIVVSILDYASASIRERVI